MTDARDPLMPQRIYVAGPYNAEKVLQIVSNVTAAAQAAEKCWARGHEAFCPHSHSDAIAHHSRYCNREITRARWLAFDLGIIERWATAVLVIGRSPGADSEVAFAEGLGLTIYHDLDEVPVVARECVQ